MIAKGKSISHLKASISYVLGREGAEILDKNIVSQTAKGVVEEFKFFQQVNVVCERNVLSFVISPAIEDGKRLSTDELEKINKSFLEKKMDELVSVLVKQLQLLPRRWAYNLLGRYNKQGREKGRFSTLR